jgi:hypothetical protein
MSYQNVREPLTAEESDRLSNACETPTERLVVWPLHDTDDVIPWNSCRHFSAGVLDPPLAPGVLDKDPAHSLDRDEEWGRYTAALGPVDRLTCLSVVGERREAELQV